MLDRMIAVIAALRRFGNSREGNTAILFGLCAIPVVIAAGIAVDATRAYTVKTRLGAAVDASALAAGSTLNETSAQLNTRMSSYFTANYPVTALGGTSASITTVPANANMNGTTIDVQGTATVPMTFMQLVGISQITVAATAEIKKTTGLEVTLVLDNTGSMLCGPSDGAPNYSNTLCAGSVVASDTTCTNAGNQSRICTLKNAATNFVNTLANSMAATSQLYIAVVPYVTTVNVGSSFCTGATTCSNLMKDSCGNWIDQEGNVPGLPLPSISVTGNLTNGSRVITNISPNTGLLDVGQPISGNGIPTNSTISSVDSTTQVTISVSATRTISNTALTANYAITGHSTAGSAVVTSITPNTADFHPGMTVTGLTAGPSGDGGLTFLAVKSVDSTSQVTLCTPATQTHTTATPLTLNSGITYDTTNNASTPNWMGCVVEPTSHGEESGSPTNVTALDSATANPDTSEPVASTTWPIYWWMPSGGGINNWSTSTIVPQTNNASTGEVQGAVITDFDHFSGPNQGCPVPLLPLTDVSNTTGKTAVLNTISSMWPRDAGGTQVAIGMIWGWRTIAPAGPFPANNTHPLSYATASTTGWQKVVVLMTDGTEEWPANTQLTGLGYLSDGKIGTNSNLTTALTNLDTRLNSVCSGMAADGIIIYTIGLGTDGQSNNTLKNTCPANGGYFVAADTTSLNSAFTQIAQSLLALRLAK